MPHKPDCDCHLHIETQCEHCGEKMIGTTRLGRHVQLKHPEHWIPRKQPKSARVLAARVLQSHAVATEMKRLARRGIRFLPKTPLGKVDVDIINAWIREMETGSADEKMLLGGLDTVERGIRSQKDFALLQASIKESAKLGMNDLPGLYDRRTWFNTDVAGECLKLAFALNRSWSFSVHLLLLYGLDALAEELATTGIEPPKRVRSPSKAVANQHAKNAMEHRRAEVAAEHHAEFLARNPTFDPDNRATPHVEKAEPYVIYERHQEVGKV